jgi:hypothetical protein
MGHGKDIKIAQEQFTVPAKGKKFAMIFMAVGVLLAAVGFFTMKSGDGHHEATAEGHHATEQHAEEAHAEEAHAEEAHAEEAHTEEAHAEEAHAEEAHGEEAHAEEAHAEEAHEASHSTADAHHIEDHNEPSEAFGPRVKYNSKPKSKLTTLLTSLLVNGYFYLLIALAALFFYCVQFIANAGWATVLLRVPLAIASFIPYAFIIVFIAVLFGYSDIYHWAHYNHLGLEKGQEGYDKILAGKSSFLNAGVLLVVPAVLVLIYFLMGRKLTKLSDAEDAAKKGDTSIFKSSIKWSAGYALVFGFLISFIAWLYIMSVDAHWFSTIFGVYNFATGWVTALSVICLLTLFLKSQGFMKLVTDEHIHDLGKFMFAFSVFWTYIWLSQYLLIWYAQIPEEMIYYQMRFENYKINFFFNLALNFIFPFLVLMTRNGKRSRWVLGITGAIIILGHWHDVWLMVNPGVFGPGQQVGLLDLGLFMLIGGGFVYVVLNALTKRGLVATNHPYIEESAHHDVGV